MCMSVGLNSQQKRTTYYTLQVQRLLYILAAR